ncbi:AraC family transcriptional regulator [Photobacterium lipolyticum]|uniref:AraC family transcriptional regulator n=1 Tax=Photobacterium lipolyticum TaxID=266810 RepID=A0A2T3N2L1_9GAMM|nr:AraC family transcriptional regulator [Photobacterium lipolyticum]PSW06612.1 AraC family transcriptional regulator [Photobacterium lipolyticum]
MNYQERFHQLLNYIDSHLDEELTVDKLSNIACLSKYHFHRQFSSLVGITAFAYIKQARMKRASYQLVFKKNMRIVDIAVANGYESSEAFSRAFSQSIGQNPSQFREQPQWVSWHEKYQLFKKLRVQRMKSEKCSYLVEIVDFSEVKVATLEHLGPLELVGNTINQFINWRKENNLSPKVSRTFNIAYDDPAVTEPEKYRCDICASVKSDVKENGYGVTTKIIPAGRCAVIRHVGSDDTISESITYLYSEWLAQSEEELRDYPLFFERVSFYPDVPEIEVTTDIYLPLK